MWRRLEDAPERMVAHMEDSPLVRDRERIRKTIDQIIKRDLEFNGLFLDLTHDQILWCHLIHVADHT